MDGITGTRNTVTEKQWEAMEWLVLNKLLAALVPRLQLQRTKNFHLTRLNWWTDQRGLLLSMIAVYCSWQETKDGNRYLIITKRKGYAQ
jgi:hypothetical protein